MARKNDLRDVVGQLRRQGHRITYKVRKDGSIRITSIDGRKFSSRLSQGNMAARAMAGKPMSERALHQRKQYSSRIKNKKIPKKKTTLSPELRRALRRTQRAIRKAKQGTASTGTVSAANVRRVVEEEGEEVALRKMERAIRYFQGYAYEENVDALLARVKQVGEGLARGDRALAKRMKELYKTIESKREVFREAWILPIRNIIYDIVNAGYRGLASVPALINAIEKIMED